ncbi:trypsin-like peptidase domain-containing protein [Streptomyces sp. NPDC052101]|uniref:nSTAND1 domain-containing NTPase n=1 Tax=Streptomyces sp. NPDC052101 TaxID=3155763 RepID=UPI003426C6B4
MNPALGRLAASVVRVRSVTGEVAGAGFVVGDGLVCTCAHVVAHALGIEGQEVRAPDEAVRVDFPLLEEAGAVAARVHHWEPVRPDDSGDIALLELVEPVPGALPAPLVAGGDVWNHAFRVLGFPRDRDHGIWVQGSLRGTQGLGWLQMDTVPGAPRIERGFSGSPVWDDDLNGVVGMTVAADGPARPGTAYLIPASALGEVAPQQWPNPYRGLEPFSEGDGGVFKGRDDDIEELVSAIRGRALVAVIGPSGCGKSSLIRAGVLPRLQASGMTVTRLRPLPGVRPELLLAQAVLPHLEPGLDEVERLTHARTLADLFSGEEVGLLAARLVEGRDVQRGEGGHLLFLDQFEEIVVSEPQAARELLRILAVMTRAVSGLRVVMTLRSKFVDDLLTSDVARLLRTVLIAPLEGEQLRTAITEPTASVPGLVFESGLVERLVADAGEEPGRLPLIEFALTRLFEHQVAGMLTHAAYDAIGRVGGALAAYAEDSWFNRLTPQERPVARRAFTQLARPDDRGGFVRRPASADSFDSQAWQLLLRLSAETRLVVVSQGASAQERIVDLAHEALIRQWGRLHDWLVEDRDFRASQEQLRERIGQWNETGQDPGGLLRGAALAQAAEWLTSRSEDLAPAERHFIVISRRAEQRGIRRWRAVTAFAITLALVAGALAVLTLRSNNVIHRQLRTQASRLIGQEAQRQAGAAPATALQLALAAWHNDPSTGEAYAALLQQQLTAGAAEKVLPGLWPGGFKHWNSSADGQTVVVISLLTNGREAMTVWTGMLGDHPRPWHVPEGSGGVWTALSPDGRTLAVARRDGSVGLWDVPGRRGPTVLQRPDAEPTPSVIDTGVLTFSSDGSRLLQFRYGTEGYIAQKRGPAIRVWDMKRRQPVAAGGSLLTLGGSPDQVAFAPGAQSVLTTYGHLPHRVDIATGKEEHAIAEKDTISIVRGGQSLLTCGYGKGFSPTLRVVDLDSGVRREIDGVTSCPNTAVEDPQWLDATGRFLVTESEATGERYQLLVLNDLATGRAYQTTVPSTDTAPSQGMGSNLIVLPQRDGRPVVLAAVGPDLMRLRAAQISTHTLEGSPTAITSADTVTEGLTPLSPSGRYWASGFNKQLTIIDAHSHQQLSTEPEPAGTADDSQLAFSGDNASLGLLSRHTLTVYSVPELTRRFQVRIPDPPLAGQEDTTSVQSMWYDGMMPGEGSELVVLRGGAFTRWYTRTGHMAAPQLTVARTSTEAKDVASHGRAFPRLGHPGQWLLAMPDGTVQLWDLPRRRLLSQFQVGTHLDAGHVNEPLVTDSTGKRLAVVGTTGTVTVWDMNARRPSYEPLPVKGITKVVGFGPPDTLFVLAGSKTNDNGELQIWDLPHHRQIATVDAPDRVHHWMIRDGRLYAYLARTEIITELNPDNWFRTLCAAADRGFTPDERKLLPAGTDTAPPCGS